MILVIGLDGYAWDWRGHLERERFYVQPLFSPHALSGPAWTSLFTGLRAETHGVEHSSLPRYVEGNKKERPLRYLWDQLAVADREAVVVGVPFTHPPRLTRRLLVCGYPTLPDHFCYPRIRQKDWPYEHLDLYYRHEGETPEEFLAVPDEQLRAEAMESRWRQAHWFLKAVTEHPPDLAVLCLTDLDRLGHYTYRSFREEEIRDTVIVDIMAMVRRLIDRLAPDWTFLVSDHGQDLSQPPREGDGWGQCHGAKLPKSRWGVFAYQGERAQPLPQRTQIDLEDLVPTLLYLMDLSPNAPIEGAARMEIQCDGDKDDDWMREQLEGLGYL